MATPFQIAWTFLKSLPYDDEYEDENHRAIVEGGEHRGEKLWNHGMAPRKITTIPSPDDAQDNYALNESLNDEEDEDYYEQDKDDTNATPMTEEEMYRLFSQEQENPVL
tara:strand:+ start:55 stop:381 length:327 start_codon:yes stop_codon:yes gene_type:complete